MKPDAEIKKSVKEKYAQIAKGEITSQSMTTPSSCCCGDSKQVVVDVSAKYSDVDRTAIPEGADLGLGCGTPAAFADLKEGMTVLDLGSGAGIDCFVAAKYVGPTGKVIGVDMTREMIDKANTNKIQVAAANVDFRLGEIEALPVESGTVDRVISNCVINLVPDKRKAFAEIHRVLKRGGGSFTVSDIVVDGDLTEEERRDAALWAGCISGALTRDAYLATIREAGFIDIRVTAERKYDYRLRNGGGVFSITVSGTKH